MDNNTQEQATNILFYTNQCQLECQYCYEQQRMNLSEPFMTKFEDFKDNIDKLALNDYVNCLVIFGGEPTLAIDAIYDTINYTNTNYPNKFTYYMNTNGIKFSDENVFNKFKDFYNKLVFIYHESRGARLNGYSDGRIKDLDTALEKILLQI